MNIPKVGCVNHDCDKCKKTRQILKDMEQAHYRLQKRYAELESKGVVQERNFCERCGKRIYADGHIHTCTPPQNTIKGLT